MVIPDDKNIALRNCAGCAAILGCVFSVGSLLHLLGANHVIGVCMGCLILFLILVFLIFKYAKVTAENAYFQIWAPRFVVAALCLLSVLWVTDLASRSLLDGRTDVMKTNVIKTTTFKVNPQCFNSLSSGQWALAPCTPAESAGAAYCGSQKWIWTSSGPQCPLTRITTTKARVLFKGRKVLLVGDSVVRGMYHELNELLDPTNYKQSYNSTLKHADLHYHIKAINTSISFFWNPLAKELANRLGDHNGHKETDLLVIGATLWDALYERDLKAYEGHLVAIAKSISKYNTVVWVQPTVVIDERLKTPEKQQFMTEAIVQNYRNAVLNTASLVSKLTAILDTHNVSLSREESCVDGVHYGDEVYAVMTQMAANAYALKTPSFYASKPIKKNVGGKVTGSMSSPFYGALLLLLATIMMFTMDSFLGLGALSLAIFGRSADWEAAYSPLLKKILGSSVVRDLVPDKEEAVGLLSKSTEKDEVKVSDQENK